MDLRLDDLRTTLAYRRARGEVMTQLELDIIALIDELYEKAMPGPPGLPVECLKAMAMLLKDQDFCEDCQDLKSNKHWCHTYGCCDECAWNYSLGG